MIGISNGGHNKALQLTARQHASQGTLFGAAWMLNARRSRSALCASLRLKYETTADCVNAIQSRRRLFSAKLSFCQRFDRESNEVSESGHPENNRRVIFRVVNKSNRPVVIYGFKYDGEFAPTGYMMALNKDKNSVEYPNPANVPTKWSDASSMMKDKRVLKPGESINIVAELSEFEVGLHFRRTVYAAYKENDNPCEISGEEFVLK